MITHNDIAAGVRDAILEEFEGAVVSNNPYDHLEGPAFIVKCVGGVHDRFSPTHAHRLYNFDIVYFHPIDQPVSEMDTIGQRLANAFIMPIKFAGRYIQPTAITTAKVDKDFHVTFNLDFYDELPQPEYEYMRELYMEFNADFKIEIKE